MRRWTITVEMPDGAERTYVSWGDTAAHAKNNLRRIVNIQFVKESRPWKEGDQRFECLPRPR